MSPWGPSINNVVHLEGGVVKIALKTDDMVYGSIDKLEKMYKQLLLM